MLASEVLLLREIAERPKSNSPKYVTDLSQLEQVSMTFELDLGNPGDAASLRRLTLLPHDADDRPAGRIYLEDIPLTRYLTLRNTAGLTDIKTVFEKTLVIVSVTALVSIEVEVEVEVSPLRKLGGYSDGCIQN